MAEELKTPTKPERTERTMIITLATKGCYREGKFPEGDPRRDCHLGLKRLDPSICGHCTWYQTADQKPVAALTGNTIGKALQALKAIAQETAAEDAAAAAGGA